MLALLQLQLPKHIKYNVFAASYCQLNEQFSISVAFIRLTVVVNLLQIIMLACM